MSLARIVGEKFFPSKGREYPATELPRPLLSLLQTHKLAGPHGRRTRINLLKALKHIRKWQDDLAKTPPGSRNGGSSSTKRAGPYEKTIPVRSPGALAEVRHAITDFLMQSFGAKPFIPVDKKGRDSWITLGWSESNFVRTWVSVVDLDNRDVSNWNQRRITNRDGTYTAVLAHEFHRLTRDRAHVIRMWLPALDVAVLFTRDGTSPQARPAASRSRNRELTCFPLQALWDALGAGLA